MSVDRRRSAAAVRLPGLFRHRHGPHLLEVRRSRGLLVIAGIAAVTLASSRATGETWTNLSGTKSIEADMIGLFGDKLVLRLESGRRVGVTLDQLRAESRLQAKRLSRQLAEQRQARIAELERQREAAEAAAPDPLPEPPPAPEYQRPEQGLSPTETYERLSRELRGGHILVLYDLLPPSYRSSLDELARQAAMKVDPAAWDAVTGAIHRIGDLVVSHQNWVFSHPRLKTRAGTDTEAMKQGVLTVAGLLRDGFAPEVASLEELRQMPLRDWLVKLDARIAPYLAEAARQSESEFPQVELAGQRDGAAAVRVDDQQTQLQLVEGFWVPADLAQQFGPGVERMRETLQSTPDGSLGGQGVAALIAGTVEPYLAPFENASSDDEFHAAMNDLLAEAQAKFGSALMAMQQNFGNRGPDGGQGGAAYGMPPQGYDPEAAGSGMPGMPPGGYPDPAATGEFEQPGLAPPGMSDNYNSSGNRGGSSLGNRGGSAAGHGGGSAAGNRGGSAAGHGGGSSLGNRGGSAGGS